jgi:hypothetical protein
MREILEAARGKRPEPQRHEYASSYALALEKKGYELELRDEYPRHRNMVKASIPLLRDLEQFTHQNLDLLSKKEEELLQNAALLIRTMAVPVALIKATDRKGEEEREMMTIMMGRED